MHRNLIWLAVALTFSVPFSQANAQSSVPKRPGSVPKQPVRMPEDSKTGQPQAFPAEVETDENGDAKKVWLAIEGFEPLSLPQADAPLATNSAPSRFMQEFQVLTYDQTLKGTYWLLAESAKKPYGWVPVDFLVRDSQALRVPSTTIVRKGMLVTRPEDAGKKESEIYATGMPGDQRRKQGPYNLSNFFFIYGETDPKTFGRPGVVEPHVLLGTATSFSASSSGINVVDDENSDLPESIVKGWVPARRVLSWDTREAIEWDRPSTLPTSSPRRSKPGLIVRTVKGAFDLLEGAEKSPEASGVLLFERFLKEGADSNTSAPFLPHHARYPVLKYDGTDEHPAEYRKNKILKVGGTGGFGQFSSNQIDDLRQQLDNIKITVTQIEILFVIDDTKSMKDHFPVVAEVVRRISRGTPREKSEKVRAGVVFYNDTDGHEKKEDTGGHEKKEKWNPVTVKALQDLAPGDRTLEDYVGKHEPMAGGDPLEMVFEGLTKGISGAGFSRHARKLVILIGDAGDRTSQADLPREIERIAALFAPKGQSPIEFYAIRVNKPNSSVSRAFETQTRAIAERLNASSGSPKKILAGCVSADDKSLEELLNARFEALKAESEQLSKQIEGLQLGQFQADVGPELEKMLERHGVPLAKLREVQGAQVFSEGYVWKRTAGDNPLPQVRSMYLLSHRNIEELIRVMEPLVGRKNDLFDKKTSLKDVLTSVIKLATNDPIKNEESFDEIVLKKMGIEARSPLLTMKLSKDIPLRASAPELEKIKLRLAKLQDVLDGNSRTWTPRTRTVGDVTLTYYEGGPAKRLERFWRIPGNPLKWYWIDAEEEIP